MSTQTNTIPAIRALVWERWRVMRWVIFWACLAYLPFAWVLTYAVDPDTNAFRVMAGGSPFDHQMNVFGFILVAAFPALLMHSEQSGLWWSFRILPHQLRLPIPKFLIALTQFALSLGGVSLLFAALLVIDLAMLGSLAILLNQPVAQWLLIALVHAAAIHAWLVLVPVGVTMLLIVLALAFVPGMWETETMTPQILAAQLGVIAACALASIYFHSLTRVHATAFLQTTLPLPAFRRRPPSKLWGPGRALAWYERRTWGVSFAGAFALAALISSASLLIKPETTALSDWLLTMLLISTLFAAAVTGYADMRPSVFRALRPVSTVRLALTGILSRASVLLFMALGAVLVGVAGILLDTHTGSIATFVVQHPMDASLITITLFLLAWLAFSSFYFTALILGAFVIFERVVHINAPVSIHDALMAYLALPALFVVVITIDVLLGRLLSWRMVAGLAAGVALIAAICTAFITRMTQFPLVEGLTGSNPLHFALVAFLVLYYPIICRIHALYRLRTNLPPGRFAEDGNE